MPILMLFWHSVKETQSGEHLLELAHYFAVLGRPSVDRGDVRQRHKHVRPDTDMILWPCILRIGRWDENQPITPHGRERVENISGWPLCCGISVIITNSQISTCLHWWTNEGGLRTLGEAHLEKATSEGLSLGIRFERLDFLEMGYGHPRDSKLG
jgi:hypothetical protein